MRGLFAGVEVLVKPITRRTINACLAPFDLGDFVLMAIRIKDEGRTAWA
jgi:hypothetical protein